MIPHTGRPYQTQAITDLRRSFAKKHSRVILQLATGGGKCLGRGTPVMLASGAVVPVESVVVGDRLMGPDGKPRTVLSLGRGVSQLYRVVPVKGDPYVVNAAHILSLKPTPGSGTITLSDGSRVSDSMDVVNVGIETYINSSSTAHHCLKGWRAEAIQKFEREGETLPMPAYLVGAYIGDGTLGEPSLTKPMSRMVLEWLAYGATLGLSFYVNHDDKCPTWRLTSGRIGGSRNPATEKLSQIGILTERKIPDAYLYSDIETRRDLLAGLIDSDGHISNAGCDWITKHEALAQQFAFLCRSLGLSCYLSQCEKGIAKTGFVGTYWRASISGDLSHIPMRDKIAPRREQKKRHLVHGIRIEDAGIGEYFGFEIDGDHLFLLGDFTVTHNTWIASEIVRNAVAKGHKVLFLAPRRELIYQAEAAFRRNGIRAGIIMAGERAMPLVDVQIASFDTLHARAIRSDRMPLPEAKVVIVDEAHLSIAETRKEILAAYPDAVIIGLTATPARGDGRGLGEIYQDIVFGPTIRDLVDQGHLVPLRYFAPTQPDLSKLKLNKDGDYAEKGLAKRMNNPKLIGDIVDNWQRLASDRRTVVFCVDCAHSRNVCEAFQKVGIAAEHVDGETPLDERADIFDRVKHGETRVLCNVFVASYGLDIPGLDCAVLARPTKNITLYLQTIGRVMRPTASKKDAYVIDHAGAVDENGFADDFIPWSLDGESKVKDRKKAAQEAKSEPKQILCENCHQMFKGARKCPHCGHQCIPSNKGIPVHKADLHEIKRTPESRAELMTLEDKRQFIGELFGYARIHNLQDGWVAHKFRAYTSEWPTDQLKASAMRTPTRQTENWIRSQNIRWAKSRHNDANR